MTTTTLQENATATCTYCHEAITVLGGMWTGPDGCTACPANFSALAAPHEPQGAAR